MTPWLAKNRHVLTESLVHSTENQLQKDDINKRRKTKTSGYNDIVACDGGDSAEHRLGATRRCREPAEAERAYEDASTKTP